MRRQLAAGWVETRYHVWSKTAYTVTALCLIQSQPATRGTSKKWQHVGPCLTIAEENVAKERQMIWSLTAVHPYSLQSQWCGANPIDSLILQPFIVGLMLINHGNLAACNSWIKLFNSYKTSSLARMFALFRQKPCKALRRSSSVPYIYFTWYQQILWSFLLLDLKMLTKFLYRPILCRDQLQMSYSSKSTRLSRAKTRLVFLHSFLATPFWFDAIF